MSESRSNICSMIFSVICIIEVTFHIENFNDFPVSADGEPYCVTSLNAPCLIYTDTFFCLTKQLTFKTICWMIYFSYIIPDTIDTFVNK